MPTTEETRYDEYLGLRIESDLKRRVLAHVRKLRPRVKLAEWVRQVLWDAVTTKPQTQQQKEN